MGNGKGGLSDCLIICGAATLYCFVLIVVLFLGGLGIAKIVMGAIYLHDCSIERLIPIYLIVSGVSPILFSGFRRSSNDDENQNSIVGTICGVVGFLFNLAWLICGSVWVYPNYGVVMADGFTSCTGNVTTDCTDGDCNRSLIKFAFGMVTLDWLLMVLCCVLIGCMFFRSCKN